MKIKSEKQQLREKRDYVEQLINWQDIALKRAEKRYRIKKNWSFSFWIFNDSDTCRFIYERERGIKDTLQEYLDLINTQLINCN